MPETTRETIHFTGHVQGVGFRYATSQVAREFEVAGYVQNLSDGRVLIEAEGRPGEIDGFVQAVSDKMHGYIRKTDRKRARGEAVFQGFQIR